MRPSAPPALGPWARGPRGQAGELLPLALRRWSFPWPPVHFFIPGSCQLGAGRSGKQPRHPVERTESVLRRFLSCPWGLCAQTFDCSCNAGWGNRMTATLERTELTCCLLRPAPASCSQAWLCAIRCRGQWWPRQCTQDHAPDHAKHGVPGQGPSSSCHCTIQFP